MPLPVSLQDVIDEMDMQNDMSHGYINRKTGELTVFTDEDEYALKGLDDGDPIEELPEWQQEMVPKLREVSESDDFIQLPSQFEIHEYSIMEDFIYSLEDGSMKDDLLHAIRGRGAFRMFKDKIIDYNIRDDWFRYKNNALKKIAVDFLEFEKIPYEDDCRE